jgi:hypothetical protein
MFDVNFASCSRPSRWGFARLGRTIPAAAEFYVPRLAFCAQRRCGSCRSENESHERPPNRPRLHLDGARARDGRQPQRLRLFRCRTALGSRPRRRGRARALDSTGGSQISSLGGALRKKCSACEHPVKPDDLMLYIGRPSGPWAWPTEIRRWRPDCCGDR